MKTKYIRIISKTILPIGGFRSLPAEVGSAFPADLALPPSPMEHPVEISGTVDVGVHPMEPVNDSIFMIEPRL